MWNNTLLANFYSPSTIDVDRFAVAIYAKPSWALLISMFSGAVLDDDDPPIPRTLANYEKSINPLQPEVIRRAIHSTHPGPWELVMAAHEKAAPHWKNNLYAPQDIEALARVNRQLEKAKCPANLVNFLGRDLVRQHRFNRMQSNGFKWADFKAQISRLESEAISFSNALRSCDSQALRALEHARKGLEGTLGMPDLFAPIIEGHEMRYIPSPNLLSWLDSIRAAAAGVLDACPPNSRASVTSMSDAKYGFSRRWLVLNAQSLLRCLGFKARNSATGPLARFVMEVDLASQSPDETFDCPWEMGEGESPSTWPSRYVQEMRCPIP